jgi:iron(III) transport system substrate-binding protein
MASTSPRRLRPALALTLAAALGAAGCQRAPSTSDTAQDANKVTVVCGATEQWCEAMTSQFSADTGVEAKFVRLGSGEALARVKAGKDNPEFDVWHGGPADSYAAAAGQGLLDPYVSPNAAAIAAKHKDPNGNWTGVYVGALGFCNNTKVLAAEQAAQPRSWQDLLQPSLVKNIATAHPGTSGTAYTGLWTQVARNSGNIDAAKEYVLKLHRNVLQYPKTGLAPGQMAARGEIATGIIFAHDCVALQDEGFKDLTVTFPAEGTGYEVGGLALIKGAKNPVSAKKYVDWALTAKAQEIPPTVKAYQLPTNPSAKVDPRVPNINAIKLVEYDFAAAGRAKPELVKWFEENVAQAPKE